MARSKGKMTKKEMVQKYLADMPTTQFFFFYLVGLNVDYETLGDLSDEIYDLVTWSYNNYFLKLYTLFVLAK